MTNYRFIGLTPRFYPDERGSDGRSLMALPGMVRDWSHTPDDGLWVITEDAPPAPVEAPVDFQPGPDSQPPAEVPEPAAAPVAPPEVAPAPEPEPASDPQPALTGDGFANLATAPERA